MFEYFAWARILLDTNYPHDLVKQNEYELEEHGKVKEIQKYIESLNKKGYKICFDIENACFSVKANGFPNHKSEDFDVVFKLFTFIAKKAKGSFGLIYTRDHDSPEHNEFEVWVLARGMLKKSKDNHLSPCVPLIQDEF